uniref:Uncharacterized protein n=1 Tax=Rhizophagus irregularis (strain DAOM 181602 / DAOM 197198 / MUCL 43194) TaxID=747089 RepID=U9TIH4_RHIID
MKMGVGDLFIRLTLALFEQLEKVTLLFLGNQQHLNDYIGKEGFSQSEVAS